MMDIDPIDSDIPNQYTTQQPRRRLARPVDDAHPFDLDTYIASYTGKTTTTLTTNEHSQIVRRSHRRRQTHHHHRLLPLHRPTSAEARVQPPLPSSRPIARACCLVSVRECRNVARRSGLTPCWGCRGRGHCLDRRGNQEECGGTDQIGGRAQDVHEQHDQGKHTGAWDVLVHVGVGV